MWLVNFSLGLWKHFFCTPFLIPLIINLITLPLFAFVLIQEAGWLPTDPSTLSFQLLYFLLPKESILLGNENLFGLAAWLITFLAMIGFLIEKFIKVKIDVRLLLKKLNIMIHIFIVVLYALVSTISHLVLPEQFSKVIIVFVIGYQVFSYTLTSLYIYFFRYASLMQIIFKRALTKDEEIELLNYFKIK